MQKLAVKLRASAWLLVGLFWFSQAGAGGTGLAGHFLVGAGGSTDFPDLQTALEQIELHGINDDVELLLVPGHHETHVQINPMVRTGNPEARLLIASADAGDRAKLSHTPVSAGDNWIIRINNARFVDIAALEFTVFGSSDLTTAIAFYDGGQDINIFDNSFTAHAVSVVAQQNDISLISQLNETFIDGLEIRNNDFISGGAALYLASSETNGLQHIIFSDNVLIDQTALGNTRATEVKYATNVVFNNNTVQLSNQHAHGLQFNHVNDLEFTRNKLHLNGGGHSYAVRLLSSNLQGETQTVVRNNFIQATKFGVQLTGQNDQVSLLSNSVLLTGVLSNVAFSSAIESNSSVAGGVEMRGNVLINLSTVDDTRVISVTDSGLFSASDHNLMFDVDGDGFMLDSTLYASFDDYRSGTGLDASSKFRAVDFIDPGAGDLHLDSKSLADPALLMPANAAVLRDIDGALRPGTQHRPGADDAALPDVIYVVGFDDNVGAP